MRRSSLTILSLREGFDARKWSVMHRIYLLARNVRLLISGAIFLVPAESSRDSLHQTTPETKPPDQMGYHRLTAPCLALFRHPATFSRSLSYSFGGIRASELTHVGASHRIVNRRHIFSHFRWSKRQLSGIGSIHIKECLSRLRRTFDKVFFGVVSESLLRAWHSALKRP